MRTLRRVLLVVALLVAIVPGDARSWLGLGDTRAPAALSARAERATGPPGGGVPPEYLPAAPTTSPTTSPTPARSAFPALPAHEPESTPDLPALATVVPEPGAPVASPPTPAGPPPAVVARVRESGVAIYAAAGDAQPVTALRGTTEFGTARVLLTTLTSTTITDPWVQVLLPARPNGSTGWIRRDSVDFVTVDDRITVDLAAHTLTWERGTAVVGVVNAAVGSPSTPTPPGTYFVTDVLPYGAVGAARASGQYGAWVVALNGHSDAFTTFAGGDARIAIHGTNQPGSIGTSTSSGCVRIGAAPLETLAHNVPLGTPVVIR